MERWRDTRYAFRSLLRRPGYTIATVLVLGIGVGAVSLIFSTFNTVVLQQLPYPKPDRLVWVSSLTPSGDENSTAYLDYQDFRDGTQAFDSLSAYMLFTQAQILTGADEAERVSTFRVTANLIPALGVKPALGRGFRPDEEQTGQNQVALLSHDFWQRHYGGDPAAVGRRLTLDGENIEVVGVMPAGFDFPSGTQLWLPMQRSAGYASGRDNCNFLVLGRLRDGVTIEQAQAQLDVVAQRVADAYPESKKGWGVRVVSLHEHFFGSARSSILTLMAIIALLPLVACANVASLALARALGRRSEFATRLAFGASRWRLIQQLITEGVVMALAGGALGLALAHQGGALLRLLAPDALPRLDTIRVDGTVMAFALIVSLALVPLFAIVPALRATDIGISDALKTGGERVTSDLRSGLRSALVVAQVALSVTLLFGSGLLLKSFLNLQRVDPGFQPDNLLTFQLQLPLFKSWISSPAQVEQSWDEVRQQIGDLPGVRLVGAVDRLPFLGVGPLNEVWAKERPPASTAEAHSATRRFVSDGYFAAMGIPLRAGRIFKPDDSRGNRLVTIINQTLAREFFPGEDPTDRFLMLSQGDEPVALQIVGVTGDVSEVGVGQDPTPTFYLPAGLAGRKTMSMLVRTSRDPLDQVGSVRKALQSLDPDIPMSQVATMQSRLSQTLAQPKFRASMVASFAFVSLVLTAIGLYGMLAYFVRQRRHEMGIRLVLGASRSAVQRLVVSRGMMLVLWGSVIGTAAGLAAGQLIAARNWLFGVGTSDPLTLAAVVASLFTVALIACLVPAYRAARVDPARSVQST